MAIQMGFVAIVLSSFWNWEAFKTLIYIVLNWDLNVIVLLERIPPSLPLVSGMFLFELLPLKNRIDKFQVES